MRKKVLLGLFLSMVGGVVAVGCAASDEDGSGGSDPGGSGAGTGTGTGTTTDTGTTTGTTSTTTTTTTGASGDCVALCEEGKTCPDGEPTTDCNAECAETNALNQMASCADEYDLVLACVEAQPDICDLMDACTTEATDYVYCIQEYCNANPQPSCP